MTDHIKVDESFINALVKNAAWDAARVSITESEKKGDKSKDKPEDKADFETGARKGDKSNDKKKKGDKPDFTTDQRKGDKSKTHAGKDFEDDDADEMMESVEEHVCPLCESHLEEALTDAQISEHVGQIQDALLSLEEEADEDEEEDLEEEEYDAMRDADHFNRGPGKPKGPPPTIGVKKPDSDKDDVDEKKKKVMKKVKELKAASKGK